MFEKKLEKFLEHIAVKHATSASCYMFFEPKMPKIQKNDDVFHQPKRPDALKRSAK